MQSVGLSVIRAIWRLVASEAVRQRAHLLLEDRTRRKALEAERRREAAAENIPPVSRHPRRGTGSGPIRVVGYFGASHGIGASAKLAVRAFESLGVPVETLDMSAGLEPLQRPTRASAWIFYLNPPELKAALLALGPNLVLGPRYGYWAWELPKAPEAWLDAGQWVHEIWAPSHFTAQALAGARAPVRVVPHPLISSEYADVAPRPREAEFVAVSLFDFNSSAARKNPAGAIQAFHRAFGIDLAARLIIKTQGGKTFPAHLAELIAAAGPNVEIINEIWPYRAVKALIRSADVLISLHRSEGFGLTLAEAMALGVPVLATAYSGNLDFMTPQTSLLVPYHLTPVVDTQGIYRDQAWAEPDVVAAATALQSLRETPEHGTRLARAAQGHAESILSPQAWFATLPRQLQSAAVELRDLHRARAPRQGS